MARARVRASPRRVEDRADGARGAVRSWRGVGPRNTRGIERIHAYARHGVSDVHAVVRPATAAFQGLPKLKPIPYTPSSLFSLSLLFFSSSSPSSPRRHTLRHDILPPRLAHPFTSPWRFFLLLLSRSLSPPFCPSYRLSRESRPSTLNEIYILILTLSLSLLPPLPPLSLISLDRDATPGTIPSASSNFIRSRDFTRQRALPCSRGAFVLFQHGGSI